MSEGRHAPLDAIESYAFYGEDKPSGLEEPLHCETLRSRAVLHNWRFRPHRHYGMHQFFWIDRGQGTATVDGVERPLGPSTALSLPPMTVHGFVFQPEIEGWVVTLPAASLKRILANSNIRSRLREPAILTARTSAQPLFLQIADEFARFSAGRDQALASLAGLLAIWFAREIAETARRHDAPPDKGRDLMLRFIERVEADFLKHSPVAAVAAAMGVTPTHLTRVCRRFAGRPASALLADRLALEGRRQLTYTSLSIAEIAYGLGFQDPGHFSKFFRKHTGQSPSQYRLAIQTKVVSDLPP